MLRHDGSPPAADHALVDQGNGRQEVRDDVWCSGIAPLDQRLAAGGLQTAGLHEIKPQTHGDMLAAIGFALGLGAQRLRRRPGIVVWVQPVRDAGEHGRLYGWGLQPFGLDPARFVVVEPGSFAEALWVIEESLKGDADQGGGGVALVLACLGATTALVTAAGGVARSGQRSRSLSATAQRRLALAAAQGGAPCLLVSAHTGPGLGAAHTRWRVARRPSLTAPFAQAVAGGQQCRLPVIDVQTRLRLQVGLERCRGAGALMGGEDKSFAVEWCDAAYRFRLLASVADRASAPADDGPAPVQWRSTRRA